MKIAIYLPNWIGDAVMATPALRAMRFRFPGAEIVGVMRRPIDAVVEGLTTLDRLLPIAKPSLLTPWTTLADLRRLRQEAFDLAVLLPNSFQSGLLAWLSGAKERLGYDRDHRGSLLTRRVPRAARGRPYPALEQYLELVAELGCSTASKQTELHVTPRDRQTLHEFWSRHPQAANYSDTTVCLNPGGAFGQAKHWPVASFARLAHRLAVERGVRVLVLCGPAERASALRIVDAANHPAVLSLASASPSIGLTKAAIEHADLLVTTDSGPRHFALPLKVPVVTLFGPTHIAWSETYDPRATHLQLELPCGPCQKRTCPEGHHRCMRDLNPDTVFSVACQKLAITRTHAQVA